MKVEVKKPETFQPIDLCIKIETQDELELLKVLFSHDITVPEALREFRAIEQEEVKPLTMLLGAIHTSIVLSQH